MKTVFINCSPKKRFCASAYFLFLQRIFTGGEKVTEKLRTPADHDRILLLSQLCRDPAVGVRNAEEA